MSDSVQTLRVSGASPPLAPSPVVEVRLLGSVALVRADGSAIELPSVTQRRLLAVLALSAGRPVRADAVGELLELGAGALRKVVSRLRAVTGDALRTTAIGYQLDLAVDADRFALTVLSTSAGADRATELNGALALWHGDALDEFAAEQWAMADVARLHTLRATAVEELAERWIDAGRGGDAIALLEPHVLDHPLADAPQALMIRALASVGRQAQALRAANRYRSELREVSGLEPGRPFREVEQRIVAGWDGITPTMRRLEAATHRVSAPSTRRVGPAAPLSSVVDHLSLHRVVTLTGPGGVGKTRTSLDAAAAAAGRFRDGVVVVDLAPIGGPSTLPDAVASSLAVATRSGLSVTASVVERLSGSHLLLVLDNCEHVVHAAAELVRAVVAGCPLVTVMATSREALGVRGEQIVTIRPLAIDDAVELFRDRALAADDSITFEGDEFAAVEAICRRLDGLPLAIELAAARVRSIAPVDLLARLDHRFDVLGSARDGQHHQRTLWTTIDWSYQLLDIDEQRLLERLSVFHGSFDLDAVEQVCFDASAGPVGSSLAGLVDKSMVVTERSGGSLRYRLLDTIQQFAAERLAERGVVDDTSRRHALHYVTLAESTSHMWLGPRQVAADDVFMREWANLRAARAWADTHDEHLWAERLLLATVAHSHTRMRSEHGVWCSASVDAADVTSVVPSSALLGWAAWWTMIGGDLPTAIEWSARGLCVAASSDDTGLVICRSVLAFALWSSGRADEATPYVTDLAASITGLPLWDAYTGQRSLFVFSGPDGYDECAARVAEITEAIGSPALLASARFYQGTAQISGRRSAAAAATYHREGIELARTAGAELVECQNLQGLLDAEVLLEAPTVRTVCIEAIERLYELRYWLYLWRVLDGAACVIARAGRMHQAALLLGHLDRQAAPWRTQPRATTRALVENAGLDPSALAEGAALGRDEAVDLALRTLTDLDV